MRCLAVFMLSVCLCFSAASALAQVLVYGFNSAGQAYTDSQGNSFAADTPYGAGGAGYVGGVIIAPSRVDNSAPWTTYDGPLHDEQRRGIGAYRFDLPPGDYLLRLYWCEALVHGPNLRLLDVRVEGNLLIDDLDLGAYPGFMACYEISRLVTVTDGTLDVEFAASRGATIISAIAVFTVDDPGVAPGAPSGFTVRDGYGMNILRWDADFDYQHEDALVYRANAAGGPFALVARVPATAERFYDTSAVNGQQHHYRVAVEDIWGRESAPSRTASSTSLHWGSSTLPVFRMSLAQADLDSLNAHPFGDDYYPAFWGVDISPLYSVDARYRGGMSRYFSKKSWKLNLPGVLQYNDWTVLHLVSNPDDQYLINNEVSLRIFDSLRPLNSESEFVHLEFQGEYWGVYQLVEEVDSDFLARRGISESGSLFKAYSDMRVVSPEYIYTFYYDKKAGPDDSYVDLIDFIRNVNGLDDYDFPPYAAENIDTENFNDYYSMMIYTRQLDFIERNYYLYHSMESGLWSIIPWDMNIAFYHTDLPLDFGTQNSPHFWGGAWNRLYDRILSVPRLRWDYAKRLQELNATVMNGPVLAPLVNQIYNGIAFDAARDVHKAFMDDNTYIDVAAGLTIYRMNQRDAQLAVSLPTFLAEIPTVCINEFMNLPGGAEELPYGWEYPGDRNVTSSWIELYNFGDAPVSLRDVEITRDGQPGSGVTLPGASTLGGGEKLYLYLDGRPDLGGNHLDLEPAPLGGTWVLLGAEGDAWDRVRYGPASLALSEGRQPDGWINWNRMTPTPLGVNSMLLPHRIVSASMAPAQPQQSDSLRFTALAVDPGGQPLALRLRWTLNGGPAHAADFHPGIQHGDFVLDLGPRNQGGVFKWWVEALRPDELLITDPPAAPFYTHQALILDESLPLFLNEFMASNGTTLPDETGDYDDWVEIHNSGALPIDLAGFGLTDDLANPFKYTFPADTLSVLQPGGFLLVWADDEPWEGPLHAAFKLSASGEDLGLFLPDGDPLDWLTFGSQLSDISFGRATDAGEPWEYLPFASPGWSNQLPPAAEQPEQPGELTLRASPNPFNPRTTLSFVNPVPGEVKLEIFDARGRRVRSLLNETAPAGERSIQWDGKDDRGQTLSTGLYFARVEAAGEASTRKVMVLK